MAKTERVAATCAVKEDDRGEPFLIFEAAHMPSLPKVYFGLELKPGTTMEDAEDLADLINIRAKGIYALFI